MTQQDDARRFAESLIRNYGARALGIVQLRLRLLEDEQRDFAAGLWREVADAIEKLQATAPESSDVG